MATPRIMIRFRDKNNRAIDLHNHIFSKNGKAYWGVWLKDFEDKDEVTSRLKRTAPGPTIYIADTESKTRPLIYIANVGAIRSAPEIDRNLVPDYYRDKINDVPVWFELRSAIQQIDADNALAALLGGANHLFSQIRFKK
jgi:hypothetical protein